jgi:AraC-like DNA-binding protein
MTNLQIWSDFAARQETARPLTFVYGALHTVLRGDYCRAHSHRSIEIVYHPTGRGVTRFDARRAISFRECSAVIYAPNQMHDQEMFSSGADMCVQLDVSNVTEPLPVTELHIPQVDDPILIGDIRGLSQRGLQLHPGEQAIYNFRATAALLALIRVACAKDVRQKASLAEQRVLQVEDYIREHFSTITSLREVSDQVGISPDFLRHTFKKLRAKSIVRYLNEVRIDRVKELLTHSRLSLKQIAPICGFNNEYYLSTVFRRLSGTVPGQYRRSLSPKQRRARPPRGAAIRANPRSPG